MLFDVQQVFALMILLCLFIYFMFEYYYNDIVGTRPTNDIVQFHHQSRMFTCFFHQKCLCVLLKGCLRVSLLLCNSLCGKGLFMCQRLFEMYVICVDVTYIYDAL